MVKHALIRAGRTCAQAALVVYGAGIATASSLSDFVDRSLLEASAVAGGIALVSFATNLVEGGVGVKYDRG